MGIASRVRHDVTDRAIRAAGAAAKYALDTSPGLRRQLAAAAGALLSYEGAKRPYFDKTWGTGAEGPTSVVLDSLPTLRARSRYLVRNNPHARRAIKSLTHGLVGTGLIPRTKSDKQDQLWRDFARECIVDSDMGFNGAQSVISDAAYESGGCLIRRRPRLKTDGLTVPLQIEIMETDMLDTTMDTNTAFNDEGATIMGGIEFNRIGQRIAYHVYKQHPAESSSFGGDQSVRVPASEIAHFFLPDRPGQVQGAPALSSVIQALNQLDGYRLSERIGKRLRASVVAFVNGGDETGLAGGAESDGQTPARMLENIGPGAVIPTPEGSQTTFPQSVSDTSYPSYLKAELHAIAAGAGSTYEQMTGDLEGVNYSSIRAGLLNFRGEQQNTRENFLISMALDIVYGWFVDAAMLTGQLPMTAQRYPEWSRPAHVDIDRVKEANADKLELESKTRSPQDVIGSKGRDWRKTIDEWAAAQAYADSKGVSLDAVSQNVTVEEEEGDDDE